MKTLIAIGGAMELEDPVIFKELIRRAGGEKARIVVLPQASGLKDTGDEYVQKFMSLGVKRKPISLEFRSRVDADLPQHLKAVRGASGIFIAGGTHMRRASIIG